MLLRNRLPEGVLCFTGDDFNYAELIEGDAKRYSHALLGIFDAVAPSASKALAALAGDEMSTFRGVIEPTVPLSRKIFEAPTQYYKAGVVFLAWLNGHQSHFTMLAGMQSARGVHALRRHLPPCRQGQRARQAGTGGKEDPALLLRAWPR